MTDTPRTDAEEYYPHDSKYKVCDSTFCHELERELNEANKQVDQLKEAWNEAYNCFMEQVDRLVKAKIAKP
jgi:nicotinamide riboside kinase